MCNACHWRLEPDINCNYVTHKRTVLTSSFLWHLSKEQPQATENTNGKPHCRMNDYYCQVPSKGKGGNNVTTTCSCNDNGEDSPCLAIVPFGLQAQGRWDDYVWGRCCWHITVILTRHLNGFAMNVGDSIWQCVISASESHGDNFKEWCFI